MLTSKRDRSLGTEKSLQKFLEMSKKNSELTSDIIIEPNFIDALPSPRFIKSHLPLPCLPPTLVDCCKVVYVARNPKGIQLICENTIIVTCFQVTTDLHFLDVTVSWYFHHLLDPIMNTTLKIEEFAEFFMRDEGEI